MNLNVDQNILDLDGRPMNEWIRCAIVNEQKKFIFDSEGRPMMADVKQAKPLTLRTCLVESLRTGNENYKSSAKIFDNFELMMKIHGAEKPVDITELQCTILQELVCHKYKEDTLIAGQCYKMLKGAK